MLGYVVKEKDTPQGIALALTGDPSRVTELLAVNPQLRKKIVGRDMQTGKPVSTFLDADFKENVVLRLPASWKTNVGMVGSGSGQVGDTPNWWCWNHPEFTACMNNVLALAQTNCAGIAPGPDYDACVESNKIAGQNQCIGWCNSNFPTDPNANPPPDCSNATLTQICNPADDCYDAAACAAKGGQPQSNFCSNSNTIKVAQKALGVTADGIWGCISQKAFDSQSKSYKELVGDCQGVIPSKSGCGGAPPVVIKKKLGEKCVAGSECEAGLECIDGKCAQPVGPKPAGGSNTLLYILGGLALGATVVGVAYAGGAFDSKKARSGPGKVSAPRENPCGCSYQNPIQSRVTNWHKNQFPEGIEIIDQMAKTAWTDYWAREQEEKGRSFSGQEIMGQAPKTPTKAKEWAIGLAMRIGCKNPHLPGAASDPYWIMYSAFKKAVEAGGENDPEKFGHYIAMEALGHGVAWSDDNPDHGLDIPDDEFYM